MRAVGWLAVAIFAACGRSAPVAPPDAGGGSIETPDAGTKEPHTLHLHVGGNGEIRAAAFSCRSGCTQTLDGSVHLSALPDTGWKFDGWQGACAGTAACDVAMTSDRDVTAVFTVIPPPPPGNARLQIQLVGNGSGRVSSIPQGIDCPSACSMTAAIGSTIALTQQADPGSSFTGWGGGCNGNGACTLTVNSDVTVWATFGAAIPPPPPPPPPVNQCTGIAAPDVVSVQEYAARPQGAVLCGAPMGDANGTLAFPMAYNDPNRHGSLFDFVSNSGVFLQETFFQSESPRPIQQPDGLTTAGSAPYNWPWGPAVDMGRWDSKGNFLGDTLWRTGTYAQAGDPAGGLLIAGDISSDVQGATPLQHAAVMFGSGGTQGAIRWGPVALASAGPAYGAGVDLLGRAIVITGGGAKFGDGAISAQWFDRDGTALTGEFVLVTGFTAGANTWFETSPLIGGGVEVRRMDLDGYGPHLHAHALALVQSGAAAVQAPPDWMIARPDTRLQTARGGKAYAVLPYGVRSGPCSQSVEVVAPDGTSCGSATWTIASGSCETPDMMLADDGTLMLQLPPSMETVTDPSRAWHTCTWRWWTGALR